MQLRMNKTHMVHYKLRLIYNTIQWFCAWYWAAVTYITFLITELELICSGKTIFMDKSNIVVDWTSIEVCRFVCATSAFFQFFYSLFCKFVYFKNNKVFKHTRACLYRPPHRWKRKGNFLNHKKRKVQRVMRCLD